MEDKINISKGGRPPLGTNRKSNKVTVAFTDFEFEEIQKMAKDSNRKLSVLIAELAINGKVVPKYSEEDKSFEISLRRFSTNVNTIAKNLNYLSKNYKAEAVVREVQKLTNIINLIDKILK